MSEYPWNEKNNTFTWLSSLYNPFKATTIHWLRVQQWTWYNTRRQVRYYGIPKRDCISGLHQQYCHLLVSLQFLSMEQLKGRWKNKKACMLCMSIPIWLNKRWRLNQVPEMDDFDWTAVGMMGAIKSLFEQNKLSNLLNKLIYLSADNALATAGESWGWLHNWILFIWCFSHSFQMHLYYLYHKSSKKLRELQYIFKDLQNDFEMYGDDAKSLKSTGIC